MASLWTDNDHGAHPWVAPRPRPTPAAAPPPARAAQDQPARERRFGRPAALAVACAGAAIAGALIEVLR